MEAAITKYGLKVPPSTTFSDVKDLLSEEANIPGSSLHWVLMNNDTDKVEVRRKIFLILVRKFFITLKFWTINKSKM